MTVTSFFGVQAFSTWCRIQLCMKHGGVQATFSVLEASEVKFPALGGFVLPTHFLSGSGNLTTHPPGGATGNWKVWFLIVPSFVIKLEPNRLLDLAQGNVYWKNSQNVQTCVFEEFDFQVNVSSDTFFLISAFQNLLETLLKNSIKRWLQIAQTSTEK